jgi:hypothetical protein
MILERRLSLRARSVGSIIHAIGHPSSAGVGTSNYSTVASTTLRCRRASQTAVSAASHSK